MKNELIKVTTNEKGIKLVSAKELYDGLGLKKSNWARWSKTNIEENEFFEENADFVGVLHNEEGNETMDFAISLDMAKHLAMMAKTPKSHEFRKYFIECEKQLQEVSKKALLLEAIYNGGQDAVLASKQLTELEVEEAKKPLLETIEAKETQLERQKPIINFAETVMKEADNILIREMAKLITDEGFAIGERKLYQQLRDWGWVLKGSTEPSQKAMNLGVFVVEEKEYRDVYGRKKISRTTKVTGKGQILIIEKFRKEKQA